MQYSKVLQLLTLVCTQLHSACSNARSTIACEVAVASGGVSGAR